MPTHSIDPAELPSPDWAARLYDERATEMVLYGRALGLSHSESEDVLHDSFRCLLGLELPPRQPHHYLVRTFRNRAFNHRRSLLRRMLREWESTRWFEPPPSDPPVQRAAIEALTQLPPDQREVIVLKVWHELTFEAIGELLDISPNTAAGRYRYGLQKLRTRLKEESHEFAQRSGNVPAWLETADTVPEA